MESTFLKLIPGNSLAVLLKCFNDFDRSINITCDDEEGSKRTSFLDLDLRLGVGIIHNSTFRKPLNNYQYLPRDSNHPKCTFDAVVCTELFRLLRTNRVEEDYLWHRSFS